MESLTNRDGHQPDAIRVAHDVNQAMFDVLTPSPSSRKNTTWRWFRSRPGRRTKPIGRCS